MCVCVSARTARTDFRHSISDSVSVSSLARSIERSIDRSSGSSRIERLAAVLFLP